VGLRTKSPWPIFWGFWKAHRKWLKPTLIISGMLFISFVLLLVKFPHQMHSLFPWLGDK
jgi:hypothetical protein